MLASDDFKKIEVENSIYWFNANLGLVCIGPSKKSDFDKLLTNDFFKLKQNLANQKKSTSKSIILLITEKCNLACSYCYSQGGIRNPKKMDFNTAKKVIDYQINSIEEGTGNKNLVIFFHGDGEPTQNFDLIKDVTAYVKLECGIKGIIPTFKLFTNGVFNNEISQFIINNNFNLIVSIDGVEHIHDKHRYFDDGRGSFSYMIENSRNLIRNKINIRARFTVTEHNVNKMLDTVIFLKNEGFKGIVFEPVKKSIRTIENSIKPVDFDCYTSSLCRCIEYGYTNSIDIGCFHELRHSSIWERVKSKNSSFCGASGNFFLVSPDGDIRSCFESNANPYTYGHISDNSLIINQQSLKKLQLRTVDNITKCSECYAKFSCAGGCSYNSIIKNNQYMDIDTSYCKSNKSIIAKTIDVIYKNAHLDKNEILSLYEI